MIAPFVDEFAVQDVVRDLAEVTEIWDEHGELLGYFAPASVDWPTPDDFEAAKRRPRTPGVSTADLLRRLRALDTPSASSS